MTDSRNVIKLYAGMEDDWLESMRRAFLEDREANKTRENPAGVKFCEGRLKLIAREQARRKRAKATDAKARV